MRPAMQQAVFLGSLAFVLFPMLSFSSPFTIPYSNTSMHAITHPASFRWYSRSYNSILGRVTSYQHTAPIALISL